MPTNMNRVCPECEQGKHGNCDGDAWDFQRDERSGCACAEHKHDPAESGEVSAAELEEYWRDLAAQVQTGLLPKLEGSAATISLVPKDGQSDVKFAVELGFSIMLNKPIIALATDGNDVPPGLARVADEVVVADLAADPEGAQKLLMEAVERVLNAREGQG